MITVNCAEHHANRQMRAVQQLQKAEQISYGTTYTSKTSKFVSLLHKQYKKIDSLATEFTILT